MNIFHLLAQLNFWLDFLLLETFFFLDIIFIFLGLLKVRFCFVFIFAFDGDKLLKLNLL